MYSLLRTEATVTIIKFCVRFQALGNYPRHQRQNRTMSNYKRHGENIGGFQVNFEKGTLVRRNDYESVDISYRVFPNMY